MADVQDDSADSRTSIIGRKRGFEEVIQDRHTIESEGSADEERSHKRTRALESMIDSNTLQSSHTDSVSAAPLAVPSEHEAEPSGVSGLQVAVDEPRHAVAPAPMNWNKVVQSGGLRTSFASKKTRLNALSERVESAGPTASYNSPEASMDLEEESSGDDDTDQDDQSNSGVALGGNTGTAPNPDPEFKWGRKLSKSQVKQLSRADRKSYGEASRAAKAVARKGLKPTAALIQAEMVALRGIPKGKRQKRAFLRKARDQAAADIAHLNSLQSVSLLDFPFRIDSPLHVLSEAQKAQLSEGQLLAYKTALALDPNQQQIWTYLQTLTPDTELPSTIPVPYADLPQLYFKALNSDQLQAYARARTAYSQQLKNSTRPKGPAIPAFKTLRPTEVAALNTEERGLYENGLHLLKATEMATNFLRTLRKWPPSDQSGDVFLSMANGLTFYPRINGLETSQLFKDSYGEFILDEIVNHDGKPIELRKFSPHIFLATFLKNNAGKLPRLAGGTVKRCFEAYITKFYPHVTQYADALRLAGRVLTNKEIKASLAAVADKSHHVVNPPIGPQEAKSPIEFAADDTRSASNNVADAKSNFDHSMEPISSLQVRNGSTSDGEIMDDVLNETQLFLQQKYFPIPGEARTAVTQYCLACAHKGHDSSTCPALSCTSCSAKHSIFRCPDRQRCTKCRERGHSKADCLEKLAVPKSELQCDICGSKEHIEMTCHRIWRSFDPRPEEIRTVRQITISCYMCGSGSHFGPECGLHRGPLYTGGLTWSTANLQKYIDAASENRALSAGVDYTILSRKGFSIKGQANDPIMFNDSDDDGESFIRPKIQATERGYIRFNDKKESRPMAPLPRRPASPVAPYRDNFNSGFRSQEDFGHGMSSEYPYSNQPPSSQQGSFAFQMRPKNEVSRTNNQPAKASKNSNQNRPKAKGGSRGGARGGGGRGRR